MRIYACLPLLSFSLLWRFSNDARWYAGWNNILHLHTYRLAHNRGLMGKPFHRGTFLCHIHWLGLSVLVSSLRHRISLFSSSLALFVEVHTFFDSQSPSRAPFRGYSRFYFPYSCFNTFLLFPSPCACVLSLNPRAIFLPSRLPTCHHSGVSSVMVSFLQAAYKRSLL